MRDYILWLAKFVTILVLILVVVPLFVGVVAGISQGMAGLGEEKSAHRVAVIELGGMIENAKEIVAALHKQAKNDDIDGIVLRIDSPGGAVSPSQEIYSAV